MSTEILSMLPKITAFDGMAEEELRTVATVLRKEIDLFGDVVFKEGDAGRGCYFIVKGEVHVLKRVDAADERVLATLRAGAMFGQIALLDSGRRSATCMTMSPCVLLCLDRGDFETLFSAGSAFAFRFQHAIARSASAQLREANRRLSMLLMSKESRLEQRTSPSALREVQDILAIPDTDIHWYG